jgi:hypothetical protein
VTPAEAAPQRRLHLGSDIGDAENTSKSYVSRILRLALAARDIVEAVVAGRADQLLMLERLAGSLPMS